MSRAITSAFIIVAVALGVGVVPAAHAMPSPRAWTLVQPLTLDVYVVVGPRLVAQDLLTKPDVIPPNAEQEVPWETKYQSHQPQSLMQQPDNDTKKRVGFALGGVGVAGMSLGTLLAVAVFSGKKENIEGGSGDNLFALLGVGILTEVMLIPSIIGVGMLSGAYGDDAAYDEHGSAGDPEVYNIESWYKTATIAACIGLASFGVAAGVSLAGMSRCQARGDACWVGVVYPIAYFAELGFASELMALVDLGVAIIKDKHIAQFADRSPQQIGLTLIPMNGGLAAGVGMRF